MSQGFNGISTVGSLRSLRISTSVAFPQRMRKIALRGLKSLVPSAALMVDISVRSLVYGIVFGDLTAPITTTSGGLISNCLPGIGGVSWALLERQKKQA